MRRALPFAPFLALSCIAAGALTASVARAEPPWVDRHVTLPEHDWAFDFGLGVAHDNLPPVNPTGAGFNVEGAVSPVDRLELGVRTGIRIGDDGKATRADDYGRLFDRQTYDGGGGTFANPELRVRGALVRTPIVELALEGRAILPINTGTNFGAVFGMPLLFHLGNKARIDTGVYVPVVFDSPVATDFSAPIDVWFQPTPRLWMGPTGGIVFHSVNNRVSVPLGFGLGYQCTRTLDVKTQILFRDLNDSPQTFGFGVGIQVRIE